VIELHVPALREHREDIPLLAAHFLQSSSRGRATRLEGFSEAALDALIAYSWPGNVRELRNAVERAAAFVKGPFITTEDLPESVLASGASAAASGLRAWKQLALHRLERQYIKKALDDHGGNVSRTARALGVHRSALQRFMRRSQFSAA
jgi:DNA-binding NtrC family response regulator